MPVTYTYRKGITYYLCQRLSKTWKPGYLFTRKTDSGVLDQIPEGYRISESVSGVVPLFKDRPQLIYTEEAAHVEAALKHHARGVNLMDGCKTRPDHHLQTAWSGCGFVDGDL